MEYKRHRDKVLILDRFDSAGSGATVVPCGVPAPLFYIISCRMLSERALST
jgi:hypothetical protein